ncbi:MAG: polysaccharide biosynthesis C-terminal domain-containing protein [Bacteroidetes bacterium]|nr:polysaccharide biosynthesis C-terminal domain-containing protein [Bacteroidota bacterium]MBP7400687.1 polysaccharide biosynthesis C-terminal domain-containing protein [Chitinophagales bacterium]MBK8487279.1 polysaccharide biosynthesis C-terminal domain-containing protein [Bacteroidota bacterium]MBK8682983.1 polysaccharide biosynthesis C-terminal domain-containing protein [Bacteroidota bacterium]MBP8754294.1 polysaccharide biosynthesis C-terminal domain-containing protein [Chitinophagales bac
MQLPGYLKLLDKRTTINLILRGLSLTGKFLFVIFLAKHVTTEQLGEWGIFSTSIALSLYLVGLDFYTYSTRSILEYPEEERGALLRNQFVFYIISYIILFPLMSLLFFFGVIEMKFILFFYIILIFEHLAQESYRTFVVFSKPLIANIILFLRTGLWAFILVLLWSAGYDNFKPLKIIFLFWTSGGIMAMTVSIYFFSKFKFKSFKNIPIDWQWIRRGVKVSLLFFVGTIAFKLIDFADRYFIDYYHTKTDVGIYTFYSSMANLVEIIVHTAVVIVFSPRLIENFHHSNYDYRITQSKFTKQMALFTVLAAILLLIIIYPIILFLDKNEFLQQFDAFIILVIAEMIFNATLIFHYILYVRKHDIAIVKATVAAAVFNILLNFILIPQFSILGAAIASALSFFLLLLGKMYYSREFPEARRIIFLKFRKRKSN